MTPAFPLRSFIFVLISIFSLALVTILTTFASQEEATHQAITTVERVSVSVGGEEGDGPSERPAILADGRYISFDSTASNLVVSDTNGPLGVDVFWVDRATGEIRRVSVSSTGVEGNNFSYVSDLSNDGRFVTFYSAATTLVVSDTNGWWDVFVHDTWAGETKLVSVNSQGVQAQNGGSGSPSISDDGRYIAFSSGADNLVENDTNGFGDVFVHDLWTGETERVSVSSSGGQANFFSDSPSISSNGRFIAFSSSASNLVVGDSNGHGDIFIHDRNTGETTRVSINSTGEQSNNLSHLPAISADGRFIAYDSRATNLVPDDTNGERDVFVYDRLTGITKRVSINPSGEQGNGESRNAAISADGRFISFYSLADTLVPNDTNNEADVFVYDQLTGFIMRVSVSEAGIEGNSYSYHSALATECRCIVFDSMASNLISNDLNGVEDIFVVEWHTHFVFLPVILHSP